MIVISNKYFELKPISINSESYSIDNSSYAAVVSALLAEIFIIFDSIDNLIASRFFSRYCRNLYQLQQQNQIDLFSLIYYFVQELLFDNQESTIN